MDELDLPAIATLMEGATAEITRLKTDNQKLSRLVEIWKVILTSRTDCTPESAAAEAVKVNRLLSNQAL